MRYNSLQRRELPDLRRQARQPIVAEVQHPQRRELPDLRRQARQLIASEVNPQRRELPDLRRQVCELIALRFNTVSDVNCPITAGTARRGLE